MSTTQDRAPGSRPAPGNPKLTPRMLNHLAWVTQDVGETADFYIRILGMELASTVYDDKVPSTGDEFPYFHIFFRMQDGSTIAFFEAPGLPERVKPAHPAYDVFDHIALQAADRDELLAWQAWLTASGVEVLGPVDHKGLILSIYFHDPNGLRLEITTPIDAEWNQHTEQGHADLEMWRRTKAAALRDGKDFRSEMIALIRAERTRYDAACPPPDSRPPPASSHRKKVPMSETMKAGVASETGLAIAQIARPRPGPEQVLVRVAAAGMNRADLNAAKGAGVASKDSYGRAIGMEWAGEVVEVGATVTSLKAGDLVMCSGTGGYAEYAVADAGRTLPLHNSGLSLDQAAVLPLALITAHDAVVTNGKLSAGDVVLVHGATSAVGLTTLQIAKTLGASQIFGTSTSKIRGPRLGEFGADRVFDPSDPAWADQLLEATGGAGANVIVDMVSGASINASMKAAAVRARLVNVGRLGGVKAEFDFDLHSFKRLNYVGTTFRTRSVGEVREIIRLMRNDLWDSVVTGEIRLPIDSSFALDEAVAAHDHMRNNRHFGKIVITP